MTTFSPGATRFLIMGAPGVGKGTHAAAFAKHYEIPAISTGDIFRRHVKDKTSLGLQVESLLAAGDYVPDDITNKVVHDRLEEQDCRVGFLLDGYPRTLAQVKALDALITPGELAGVIVLTADTDELVRRLLIRAEAEGRVDDDEKTVRHRQELYERETKPLLKAYKARKLTVEVDAMGSIEEVSQRIIDAVTDYRK